MCRRLISDKYCAQPISRKLKRFKSRVILRLNDGHAFCPLDEVKLLKQAMDETTMKFDQMSLSVKEGL